jgi:hypothetical protein
MGTEIRIIESKKRVREVSEHHSKMSDPFFLITYNTEQTMDQPFSPFIKYIVPSDETNFTTIQAHFQPQPRKVCIMPKTGWRLHLSCRPVAPGEKTYIIVQNAYRISDTEARDIFLYTQSVLNYERQGQNVEDFGALSDTQVRKWLDGVNTTSSPGARSTMDQEGSKNMHPFVELERLCRNK